MAIEYTWKIVDVQRNLSDGGITNIHWTCTGVDGEYIVRQSGTSAHTPDPSAEGFVSYENVTEENCIAWAQADAGQSNIEARIAAMIETEKTPTTGVGLPW